ncbi:MAG: carboxypeptidase-like regulatory domain-containing protein [Cyclobacteriaceae bacterium]|nr:carboxypeptidase-like regulatory domain-containing protein [Cyclobacteriaceae bacterium]
MKSIFLSCCLLMASALMAQRLTITGKVVDASDGEPLSYATVGVKGKTVATISNLNGEFDFHIPVEYRNEILVISMLGYENYEVPVWAIEGPLTVRLQPHTTVLEEVVVKDSLSGGDVLRIALSRIEQNYPMKPFLLEGFYRDVKKVANTYISLLEAAVKIYDEDYAEPRNKFKLRERVRLIEVRKSLGYESRFTSFFDQDNLLEDLLLHNNIRYRQIEAREALFASMKREPDSYYNGHEIFVVAHTEQYLLRIFVDKKTYAIVHLVYETGSSNELISKRGNLVSRFAGLKKEIDFREVEGKMFLNYITMTSRVNWHDRKTDSLRFETELFQQLLINQVYPQTKDRISTTEKMRNYGLQYQDKPYNREFWENYNIIKDTPLDRKIVEDLERFAPLHRQFEGKQ